MRTLVYSPFGQSLTGTREHIFRMPAVGAPVPRRLAICYMGTLDLDRAATVLIILVRDGHGRLNGAFVGAIAYMVFSHAPAKPWRSSTSRQLMTS